MASCAQCTTPRRHAIRIRARAAAPQTMALPSSRRCLARPPYSAPRSAQPTCHVAPDSPSGLHPIRSTCSSFRTRPLLARNPSFDVRVNARHRPAAERDDGPRSRSLRGGCVYPIRNLSVANQVGARVCFHTVSEGERSPDGREFSSNRATGFGRDRRLCRWPR